MNDVLSKTAMVLAAGFGMRMRPLTLSTPKPLLRVSGRTMLDLAIDKLVAAGIERVVVNTFYLAEQIEGHLKTRTDIDIVTSREEEPLETGGGIVRALPYFEGRPFFALNADLPWVDGDEPSLRLMGRTWNPVLMDALLLVVRTQNARGFSAAGDFALDAEGRLHRKDVPAPRPFSMMAAQILNPSLFDDPPSKVFSNRIVWDRAEEKGRLFGVVHQGTCYHVGTPGDLDQANALLASGKGWGP
ncbi:MAG: nucleotidyltransferase family protein [Alphaproteobacteria bacterium]|nr:nucleotidyltransferase family protein [Alphaproteobacteria bacterium]